MKTKTIICLLLTLTSLVGCIGKQKTEERTLTVTIEPQRYFTEQIAGDKFKVLSMVPKGSSPETYDPTPQQLVNLGESEAYLRIGYIGFEVAWLDKLTDNTPHIQLFDTSKGIDLIYAEHTCGTNETEHNHSEIGVEPHVWSSVANALIIAENTRRALCQLDKENKEYYTERCDLLKQQILETDLELRKLLQGADSAFIIYHPSLSYFARDYGLKQISIEAGGKEPSPAQLKKLIEVAKKEGVNTIFVQQEFDSRNAELIAKETGTKVVRINPLAYEWKEEMINIAKALKAKE